MAYPSVVKGAAPWQLPRPRIPVRPGTHDADLGELGDGNAKAGPRIGFPYREAHELKGHQGGVMVVKFNPGGDYCMSGGKDRSVILWNPHKGTKITTYGGGHGKEVLDLCIAKDSSQFVSCGGDRIVFQWDVGQARILRRFHGHTHRVNCVAYHPNMTVLASGGFDGTLRLWDLKSNMRDPIQILDEFKDSVSSCVVTDTEIIAGSVDGKLRIFDLRMGALSTDTLGSEPITSVRMTYDGNCILASCMDSTARLMDKETGGMLGEFKGHLHKEFSIESCIANTDMHVISGSEDGRILVWNLLDASLAHTLEGHKRAVVSVDYHPELTFMVSASVDGTVKCWK